MAPAAALLGLAQNGIWLFPEVACVGRPHEATVLASLPALGMQRAPKEGPGGGWLTTSHLTSQRKGRHVML